MKMNQAKPQDKTLVISLSQAKKEGKDWFGKLARQVRKDGRVIVRLRGNQLLELKLVQQKGLIEPSTEQDEEALKTITEAFDRSWKNSMLSNEDKIRALVDEEIRAVRSKN